MEYIILCYTSHTFTTLVSYIQHLDIINYILYIQTHTTLVKPTVEYATSVWDTYMQVNIQKIEMVQRRAARFTLNRYRNRSNVSSIIEELGWTSMEERQKH